MKTALTETPTNMMEEPYVRLKTVKAIAPDLSDGYIYDHISEIPHLRRGKYLLFKVSEVRAWLEKSRVK